MLQGKASVHLMPTSVYRRIYPQIFHKDDEPRLEQFDKDWTNLVGNILVLNK